MEENGLIRLMKVNLNRNNVNDINKVNFKIYGVTDSETANTLIFL